MSRNISSVRDERNRTERKARYIRLKNKMRKYPECAYDGDFYCNAILNYYGPSHGADFSFFHTQKKRYYACALQTCQLKAYNDIEEYAMEISEARYPRPDGGFYERDPFAQERKVFCKSIMDDFIVPISIKPTIQLKNYGPVA